MKHVWHPLAETEFDEALNYYVVHAGANIGRKFATAINHTLDSPAPDAFIRRTAQVAWGSNPNYNIH